MKEEKECMEEREHRFLANNNKVMNNAAVIRLYGKLLRGKEKEGRLLIYHLVFTAMRDACLVRVRRISLAHVWYSKGPTELDTRPRG